MEQREVAPGVYRLEFAVGAKPIAMHLLAGDGLILVDSGLTDTPRRIYLPAIEEIGRQPDDVRLLVITHADADHIGGNRQVRRLFPNAQIACHALDRRWASDPAVITAERYDSFTPYGLRYDKATFDLLGGWMGPAEPVDLTLQDGVGIRLADDEWLTVRHVPGHTPGHILLHNERRGYALIGDAIFGESQLDTVGGKAAAPPYTNVGAYRSTVDTVASLGADLLLTCHYPVIRGQDVVAFAEASLAWADRADEVVRGLLDEAGGALLLGEAIERADPLLGPFAAPRELQWALLGHLQDLVARREARQVEREDVIAWEAAR